MSARGNPSIFDFLLGKNALDVDFSLTFDTGKKKFYKKDGIFCHCKGVYWIFGPS
jgi:hypothetical protein